MSDPEQREADPSPARGTTTGTSNPAEPRIWPLLAGLWQECGLGAAPRWPVPGGGHDRQPDGLILAEVANQLGATGPTWLDQLPEADMDAVRKRLRSLTDRPPAGTLLVSIIRTGASAGGRVVGAAIGTGGVPVRIWIWPAETTSSTQLRRLRRDLDGLTVIPVVGPESMLPAGMAEQLGDGHHLWGGPLREAEPAPHPDQVRQTIGNPPRIRGGRRVKEITAGAPGDRWIMLSEKEERRRSGSTRPSPDSVGGGSVGDDKDLDRWHVLHGYGGELTANQLVDGYLQLRALNRELAGPLAGRFSGPPDEAVASELVVVWLAALLRRTAETRSGRLWKSLVEKALGQPGPQSGSS